MPIKINNMESDISLTTGDGEKGFSPETIERIVRMVLQRIEKEKSMRGASAESRTSNTVLEFDMFE